MKEFYSLFISGYLISSLFLLPLTGLYFSLTLKRTSSRLILRFHKMLTLLSVLLPLLMVIISCGSYFETDLMIGGENGYEPSQIQPEAAFSTSPVTSDALIGDERGNPFPSLQDIVFYFADLILMFSLLGFLFFTLRYALQSRRMEKLKRGGRISPIGANCFLLESADVISPFSAGIFRKIIFIPKGISVSEKKVIIRHELNHFNSHHHLWSLLEAVLGCVFWFNPLTHILRRRGVFLREVECDGNTILEIDRYEYTHLLLKTAESFATGGNDTRFSLLTQGWARKGELRQRIETMMRREGMKTKKITGAAIVVGIVITVGVTLFYGNLNDVAPKAILSDIEMKYSKRAPMTERVDIEKVPAHFIKALLVQEDSNFFEHKGIHLKSIIRATTTNVKSFLSGGPLYKSGGSTITQQLAKQFVNNREKIMKHKFEELKIARVLERNFTKQEILAMYLNMIYFGNNAYGLKAASETYFGHSYAGLSLSESTMLVPFITAPSLYNVLKDPVAARKRQKQLLEKVEGAAHNS